MNALIANVRIFRFLTPFYPFVTELGLDGNVKDLFEDYLNKLLKDGKSALIGTCQSVTSKWDSNAQGATQSLDCSFLVCANVEDYFFGLKESVKDWSVSGGCSFTCAPASKCCCGTSLTFSLSAEGTGSGPGCEVTKKPNIDGLKP